MAPIKAPPAHVFNAREQLLDVAVIKAPPAHVFNAPEHLLDLPVIKAPPAQVFNVPEHLLKARAPHVMAVREQPRPKNEAFAVVRGG